MESAETHALLQLTERRFQSFSEALDSVLGVLDEAIPGTVMLGQLDQAEELCRVIEVRGGSEDLRAGMTVPLAAAGTQVNGSPEHDGFGIPLDTVLDRDFLRSLSVNASLANPLEMSDGSIMGTLCALDTGTGTYTSRHQVLLGVAARLLSYEWENVSRRAELRRLRERVRDVEHSDADTGLPNRERFLDLLEREWQLTARGSVQSILVVCSVDVDGPEAERAGSMATLGLKDAADVLSGTARSTDHVGRTGAMDLAAILVGCHGLEGAEAFVRRFRDGVSRVTQARAMPIVVACSMLPLSDSASAGEALERAEREARDPAVSAPDRVAESGETA
jgi:GGDEF domain-containing protein